MMKLFIVLIELNRLLAINYYDSNDCRGLINWHKN